MKPAARCIDMHTHIWGREDGLAVRPEDEQTLIAMADRYSIESLVVMPLFGGLYPTPDQITAGNDAVADLYRRDNRLLPFATVYPRHGSTAVKELERRIAHEGFRGLKLWVTLADQPDVYPLIETMIRHGKPVLIHALHKAIGQFPLESDPAHIARLAGRYPEARIIMAHIGGNFLYGCAAIRNTPNVWTDPSGSYCETGMIETAVRELGVNRIVFGSDAPYTDWINNVAKVMAADISDDDKDAIMYRNARYLLA